MTTPATPTLDERLAAALETLGDNPAVAQLRALFEEARKEADPGCVCRGNWRRLVAETDEKIGKYFVDRHGEKCHFFGLVWGDDDFYYGFSKPRQRAGDSGALTEEQEEQEHQARPLYLLSCVGSLPSQDMTPLLGQDGPGNVAPA